MTNRQTNIIETFKNISRTLNIDMPMVHFNPKSSSSMAGIYQPAMGEITLFFGHHEIRTALHEFAHHAHYEMDFDSYCKEQSHGKSFNYYCEMVWKIYNQAN
jgi:hypothetical protein